MKTQETTMKLSGNRCRCTGCGEYFNSTSAFDGHRTGPYTNRRCLTSEELWAKGFLKNNKGLWITASRVMA